MATNITLTNDTTNNRWTYSPQITKQSGNKLKLNTQDQFLDKNIEITPTVKAASGFTLSISSVSGSDTVTIGTLNNEYYPVTANNLSIKGTLKASTAGWFSTGEATDSDTDSVTVGKIGAAVLNSQGTVTMAPSVTISGTTNMSTASSGTYYFTRTGTVSNGTVQTSYKVTTAGYTPTKNTTNGESIPVTPTKTADATIYIPTAIGKVIMTKGNGSCSYVLASSTNVTVSDTDTSGVKVVFTGSGSVSATAKITTAGYTPINASFATGTSTSSNSTTAIKYITGVTLENEKEFDITVPNGTGTITFHFAVDANGNTTIT